MKDITKLGENIEVKKPVFDAKERASTAFRSPANICPAT